MCPNSRFPTGNTWYLTHGVVTWKKTATRSQWDVFTPKMSHLDAEIGLALTGTPHNAVNGGL